MNRWGLGAMTAALMTAAAAHGQGLDMLEPSARAAGVGGAYTAQVDDASAIFYNPGALGLLKKKKGASIGINAMQPDQVLYQGLGPGLGAGTAAERAKKRTIKPHVFATAPLTAKIVSGIGYYTPMRMESEWADPASYAGRFLATKSKIETTDLTATFGFGIGSTIGIGGGAIYRTSQLSASRRIGAQLSGSTRDVATLDIETDSVRALGWNAGIVIRPGTAFSIGARYRSRIETDYKGAGKLTQIATGDAQFDQLIAATFPFGQDVALRSTLEFPAEASVGVAFSLGQPLMLSVDATQTEWDRVQTIGFAFPNNPSLDTTYPLLLKKSTTYRGGLRYQMPTGPQFRIGYATTKSAQPDETVGPFLADAGRSTITAGFGLDWLDVAAGYTTFSDRTTITNVNAINGIYRAKAYSVVVTVTK